MLINCDESSCYDEFVLGDDNCKCENAMKLTIDFLAKNGSWNFRFFTRR